MSDKSLAIACAILAVLTCVAGITLLAVTRPEWTLLQGLVGLWPVWLLTLLIVWTAITAARGDKPAPLRPTMPMTFDLENKHIAGAIRAGEGLVVVLGPGWTGDDLGPNVFTWDEAERRGWARHLDPRATLQTHKPHMAVTENKSASFLTKDNGPGNYTLTYPKGL